MDALDFLSKQDAVHPEPSEAPKPTAAITKATQVWTGETLDIPLKDLVDNLKRNLKFKLTVFTYMANAVGVGFFNSADMTTPTGRKSLEIINDFAEDWDLDTLNQKLARDVWASGNAFLNPVEDEINPFAGVYMLPLSSFTKIYRDEHGDILKFIQNWGGRGDQDVLPGDILHARWLPVDEGAFGEGIGQAMARKGIGYETDGGTTVKRESWFQAAEKMEDVSIKMVYAGLPRYFGFFEGEGATEEYVSTVNTALNKLDPLQHFVGNVKGDIKTVSLDTQNRFDSFIKYIDDQIISGTMSPLIRLWSSLNFTYASSKEAVDAMFPLIQMYQRFHKRFVERMIYAPLIAQEGYDIKKANVKLHWGQEDPMTPAEIGDVFNILKDPAFVDKFNPEDFIDMFIDSGVKLTKPTKEEVTGDLSKLRNIIGLSEKGRSLKIMVPKPSTVRSTDPNAPAKKKIFNYLVKKYSIEDNK